MNEKGREDLRMLGFLRNFYMTKKPNKERKLGGCQTSNQAVNFTLQFPEFIIVDTASEAVAAMPTLAHCLI